MSAKRPGAQCQQHRLAKDKETQAEKIQLIKRCPKGWFKNAKAPSLDQEGTMLSSKILLHQSNDTLSNFQHMHSKSLWSAK